MQEERDYGCKSYKFPTTAMNLTGLNPDEGYNITCRSTDNDSNSLNHLVIFLNQTISEKNMLRPLAASTNYTCCLQQHETLNCLSLKTNETSPCSLVVAGTIGGIIGVIISVLIIVGITSIIIGTMILVKRKR